MSTSPCLPSVSHATHRRRAEARDRHPGAGVWVVLARAYAAVAAHVADDILARGLSPAEFGALETLYHRGPMLLGDLQRRLLVTSGAITAVVDRLAGAGLVERQACAEDRRARYAALTAVGEAFMREAFPPHAHVLTRAVSGLTADEQQALVALLRKLGHAAAQLPVPSAAGLTAGPAVPVPGPRRRGGSGRGGRRRSAVRAT